MRGHLIEIEIPKKISTNSIYAGIHFSKRKQHKDYFGWLVRKALNKAKIQKIQRFPVSLIFDFHFKSRPLDTSNTSYMAKLIEDWLVRLGHLPDDSPKYIKSISLSSAKRDSNVCFLEIRECN